MTSIVSGFPCIEATRCLITEVENGMRLTVKTSSKSFQDSRVASFTKGKSLKEEWYLHFDVARSNKKDGSTPKRVLQLRHSETGMYLCSDDRGRVTCTPSPSDSSWWFLKRVGAVNNPQATEQDGLSDTSKSSSLEISDDQYNLVSLKYPLRKLCYTKGFEGTGVDYRLLTSKNVATEPSAWTIKFTSGELCSIVNPVVHHHLRCNMYGKLSLTSQTCAWEVFRFIEAGNGDLHISSWVHFTKFLTSDSDGKVKTTDMEKKTPGQTERWRLEVAPKGNGLYIRNVATQRYLSLGRDRNEHLWTTTKPNDYAVWHLDAPQLHTYHLTSLFASAAYHQTALFASAKAAGESLDEDTIDPNQFYFQDGAYDMHVSNNKQGPYLSRNRESEEEWKVELTSEGYFTFFSVSHEKYLGSNSKGDVHTTTSKGAWSLWEKKTSPYGGVTFQSKEHKRFLAVTSADNALATTEENEKIGFCHSWRIDPCIPRTVSGGTGGYIAGVMGFNLPASMPFAVFGALEATRSSKLSKLSAALRPISAWQSWMNSEPGSAPSFVALPAQSSIEIENSHLRRELTGRSGTTNPMMETVEIETYDEPPRIVKETAEKETSEEPAKSKDETIEKTAETETSDESPKVSDEGSNEETSDEETSNEPPNSNGEGNEKTAEKETSNESAKVSDEDNKEESNDEEGDII